MYQIETRGAMAYLDYAIGIRDKRGITNLVYSYFHRSEISVRSIGANIGINSVTLLEAGSTIQEYGKAIGDSKSYTTKLYNGREIFYHGVAISNSVSDLYIVTSQSNRVKDMYSFLMNKFDYPVLYDWVPYIITTEKIKKKVVEVVGNYKDKDLLEIYESELKNEDLKELLEKGLREKSISITCKKQNKLSFSNMDEYFAKYGFVIVENLKNQINPLVGETKITKNIAFLRKRLFPQQANLVNGLIERFKHGSYAFMNEGMGCGKTLQALGVIEGFFNKTYLDQHKEASVKDVYLNKELINYRNIIMVPSHLLFKWAEYIKEEVPYAKVSIICCLKDLIEIKQSGIKRNGKEYFIVSKDTSKLSYSLYPLPVQEKFKEVKEYSCKECHSLKVFGAETCDCGCTEWILEPLGYKEQGLICPECGELIFPINIKRLKVGIEIEERTFPLQPTDFAAHTTANLICRICNAPLWAPDCNPVGGGRKKRKWKKISHYTNRTLKGRKTSWLFKDRLSEFIDKRNVVDIDVQEMPDHGIRRYSLALYIKKYLKGYFDFAIFDEAHKYKGGWSAQGIAMHQIVKASKWKLALTGTLAGGYACDLFYLLYRLDPQRMKDSEYDYSPSGERKFTENFGTLQTEFEVLSEEHQINTSSRGRTIGSPKCKPGISPLIFPKFLLDCTVFLDITEMSSQLPELIEEVVAVPLEEKIDMEYKKIRQLLKLHMRTGAGKTLLGSYLQFSLSYTDKPYGRTSICSTITGEEVVRPKNIPLNEPLNKEKELIRLVRQEQKEKRNLFIYCEYTHSPDTNVATRLRELIIKYCNMEEHEVCILESSHPKASMREQWIHERAEQGVKVFITNPRCVETGIDFCFEHNKKLYNYPTIINYQLGFSLFVVLQSNYRHYRLNQVLQCRTYYIVSEKTIQMDAIELIASKQVATHALQGKFSSEGLAAMATGVDSRIMLAQAQIEDDQEGKSQRIKEMFAKINNVAKKEKKEKEKLMLTFYELTGLKEINDTILLDSSSDDYLKILFPEYFSENKVNSTENENVIEDETVYRSIDVDDISYQIKIDTSKMKKAAKGQLSLMDMFNN